MATVLNAQWLSAAYEQLKGLRVLIVDDEVDFLRTMGLLVEALGCEVQTCSNSAECLDTVNHFHPDVALLDISMPGMDGIELAKTIHGGVELKKLALIAVSGYSEQQIRQSVGDGEFCSYLTKPVSLERLHSTLLDCTGRTLRELQTSKP